MDQYIYWSRKFLFKTNNIFKGKVSIFIMQNKNALDIDEIDDFYLLNTYSKIKNVKNFRVTSAKI